MILGTGGMGASNTGDFTAVGVGIQKPLEAAGWKYIIISKHCTLDIKDAFRYMFVVPPSHLFAL